MKSLYPNRYPWSSDLVLEDGKMVAGKHVSWRQIADAEFAIFNQTQIPVFINAQLTSNNPNYLTFTTCNLYAGIGPLARSLSVGPPPMWLYPGEAITMVITSDAAAPDAYGRLEVYAREAILGFNTSAMAGNPVDCVASEGVVSLFYKGVEDLASDESTYGQTEFTPFSWTLSGAGSISSLTAKTPYLFLYPSALLDFGHGVLGPEAAGTLFYSHMVAKTVTAGNLWGTTISHPQRVVWSSPGSVSLVMRSLGFSKQHIGMS